MCRYRSCHLSGCTGTIRHGTTLIVLTFAWGIHTDTPYTSHRPEKCMHAVMSNASFRLCFPLFPLLQVLWYSSSTVYSREIHTHIDTTDDSACTVACCPELCNCSSPLSLIDGWISIIQQYQGRSSAATGQTLGARRMWARQSSQGVGWRRATGASRQVFLLPGGAPMASSLLYTRWTGMCMCLLEFIGQAAVADPFWLVMTSTNSACARVRAADHALQTIPVRSPSPYHNGCRVTYSSLRELMYVYWCCMQQMITFRSCLDPLADSR